MESFNFTEDETHQHGGLDITIEFVANKVYDVADAPGNISPMRGPDVPSGTNRGALSRTGTGNRLSLFSTPSFGGSSPLANTVNQAWDRAAGAGGVGSGTTTGVDLDTGVLSSRRR